VAVSGFANANSSIEKQTQEKLNFWLPALLAQQSHNLRKTDSMVNAVLLMVKSKLWITFLFEKLKLLKLFELQI